MDALQQLRDNLPAHVTIAYFDMTSLDIEGVSGLVTIILPDPAVWTLQVFDGDAIIFSGDWAEIYDWLKSHGDLDERPHIPPTSNGKDS